MGTKIRYSLLWQAVLLVALQGIFLLDGGGLNGVAIARADESGAVTQVQGVYSKHVQNTMSFRENDGVIRTYPVSAAVRIIHIDGNEIELRRLIFTSRCELKILNGVIEEINVLWEPRS